MLRAVLAMWMGNARATELAATIDQGFAMVWHPRHLLQSDVVQELLEVSVIGRGARLGRAPFLLSVEEIARMFSIRDSPCFWVLRKGC